MDLMKPFKIPAEQKKEVYQELITKAEPKVDFFILVILSCIIATFGLLANNVAIIIGAMVVAPLMTPILSSSLAMLFGEIEFFYKSLSSELQGVGVALVIAVAIALVTPGAVLTDEILARTHPTIVDLILALASGAAGAYAIVRRKNAALPGIAIAVSVLPPLCVAGIGLAFRRFDVFGGGLLLFFANIIAVQIASFGVFWFFKVVPSSIYEKEKAELIMKNLRISIALFLLVSVPLAFIMYTTVSQESLSRNIESILETQASLVKGGELVKFSYQKKDGVLEISAIMRSPEKFDQKMATQIKNVLENQLKEPVDLKLEVILKDRFEAQHE
jgi:uncharacterized hydrophobic protein (TIGR00271 family)